MQTMSGTTQQELVEVAASALPIYLTEAARLDMASRVLSAVMTQTEMDVRNRVAAEILGDGPKHPYNADEQARINAWCAGLHYAAAIVRGTDETSPLS